MEFKEYQEYIELKVLKRGIEELIDNCDLSVEFMERLKFLYFSIFDKDIENCIRYKED